MAVESQMGNWRGGWLVVIVGAMTLESLVAERRLRAAEAWKYSGRTLQVRLAEFGLITVLVRVGPFLPDRLGRLVVDAQQWLRDPSLFFDIEYVITVAAVAALWGVAISISAALGELEDTGNPWADRESARATTETLFVGGLFLMLALVGLVRLPGWATSGASPTAAGSIDLLPVLYVALGVLLLGQTRYALLIKAWDRERVPRSEHMERRWIRSAVLFIILVTAIASFLPAGSTSLGLTLALVILKIAIFLGQWATFLVMLVLSVILAPCAFLSMASDRTPAARPVMPDLGAVPASQAAGWPEWARTAAFVIAVVAGVVWVARTLWEDRRAAALGRTVWHTIREWLCGIWGWLRRVREQVERATRTSHETATAGLPLASVGWQWWQARSSRERVRRLYLTLLERSARTGYPRRPAQTPHEYGVELESYVPGHRDQVSALTEAFVEARYSRREFEPGRLHALYEIWRRLKKALRRPPSPPEIAKKG